MAEDRPATGAITRAELEELADLFDQFEFAFDPLAVQARQAESQFMDKVRALYDQRVVPRHPEVPFAAFASHVRLGGRAYLRKNPPRSSQP